MSEHGLKFEARRRYSGPQGEAWDVVLLGRADGIPIAAAASELPAPEARKLAATLNEAEAMREALEPFAKFADALAANPLNRVDDEFYSIHGGDRTPGGASLYKRNIARARAILSRIEAAEKGSTP